MATTIDRSRIDKDGDRRIDKWEWDVAVKKFDPQAMYAMDLANKRLSGRLSDIAEGLEDEFSAAAEADSPFNATAEARQNILNQRMAVIERSLDEAQKAGDEQLVQTLNEQFQRLSQKAERLQRNGGEAAQLERALAPESSEPVQMRRMALTSRAPSGERTYGDARAERQAKAQTFTPPAGWGAKAINMSEPFSSDEFMAAQEMTVKAQDIWYDISNNTNKGKKLMMLFFYFARMAESGDMGAMYQFMKFITYIISKDKAKQQIEMGKKLIQLQDLSRKWTNQLLNLQSNSTDPNASSELMKTMTVVKSETDAIATSQKLISQMMEEFAQVVETLTNTTKAALETYGRIMRTVSSIRG